MDYEAFSASPSGRLVPTSHGQRAFVPHDLPPFLRTDGLLHALGTTMQAIGNLNGVSRRFANPNMLIRPLQRREALTSSSMEGTHASPDDLVMLEAGQDVMEGGATREVLNYITALDEAVGMLDRLPISWRMMAAVHATLLSGLGKFRGGNKLPGEPKAHQNFIGGRGIEDARFIPPPPREAREAIASLERYINAEVPSLPPILDAALLHYQFETIHPFADGNGRVGRMLIPLYLMQRGVLERPILYVSPFIEEHKDEYVDRMFEVSRSGAWEAWIEFFLRAVRETCEDTASTVDSLLELHALYRETAHSVSRSSSAQRIVDALFERPVISVPDAAGIAGVTYAAAATTVGKLVEARVLRELPGTAMPKRYMAVEVVRMSSGYFSRRDVDTSEPM